MPLQRRIPKRGFQNPFRKVFAVVNVGQVGGALRSRGRGGTPPPIIESGLVKKLYNGIKLLGDGELTKKLTVKVVKASKSAQAKVEAAGGTLEVLELSQAETPAEQAE